MIRTPAGLAAYAAAADVVLVLAFAASGRSSHAEALTPLGVLTTAWPFLAGLALGWAVSRSWRAPLLIWPNGVAIWAITVAGGMVLRIATGDTAQLAFIIVASIVLAVFLLGHRMLARLVVRRAKQNRSGARMR
jgi:hypothetical protein